jgi:photosystem II stability/assembly factor-like uncharacterized protein
VISLVPRHTDPQVRVGGSVWCTWDAGATYVFSADQAEQVLTDTVVAAGDD